MLIEFSDATIFNWLENQTENSFNEVPFGVVKMNHKGEVTFYNKHESEITGVEPSTTIGKVFFTQVAPCTNNFMVAEKYKQDELDEELDYLFTYVTTPTKVRLRLLKSAQFAHQYMLVRKY